MDNKQFRPDRCLSLDINSHEFTLEALAELYNQVNRNKIDIRRTRRFDSYLALKTTVILAVGYYCYRGVMYRLKKIEKKLNKEEPTE